METQTYGYARVSSRDQNQARQHEALRDAGINEKNIYTDKASGKDFEREQYQRLRARLKCGDILIIKSIDRLGRNYDEIISEWKAITKELKAHIKVLDLPLLDTTRSDKDLTGTFISDIVLQILSYVAEQERINIRQRQAEGIALAKARGKVFGRPKIKCPEMFDEVYHRWVKREIPFREVMALLGLKRTTFYKFAAKSRADERIPISVPPNPAHLIDSLPNEGL